MKFSLMSIALLCLSLFAFMTPASASVGASEQWIAASVPVAETDAAVKTPLVEVADIAIDKFTPSTSTAAFDGSGACSERHATSMPSRCYGHASATATADQGDEDPEPEWRT